MKVMELFEALRSLPVWVQVSWAVWLMFGIALTVLSANSSHSKTASDLPQTGTPAGTSDSLRTHPENLNVSPDDAKTRSLIFGEIDVEIPYGYLMVAQSEDSQQRKLQVYAQPARTISLPLSEPSQDVVLSFDVTNQDDLQIRITNIFIEVIEFIPVRVIETRPVAAAGEIRPYFCNIRNSQGSYRAEKASAKFDYIKISKGELERVGVHVNSPDQGIYALAVTIEFSVGNATRRISVGRVPRLVGFF